MPPPSPLAIATSSVQRLVKEEVSYHKELEKQEARLEKTQASVANGDENAEFQLKQEKQAIEETRNVFPSLRERIAAATARLQDQLEAWVENRQGTPEEIQKAKEVIGQAKATLDGKEPLGLKLEGEL